MCSFALSIAKRTLYAYADDAEERDEWMNALKEAASAGRESLAVQYEATHTLLTTLWLSADETAGDALNRALNVVRDEFAYDVIDHPDDAMWAVFAMGADASDDAPERLDDAAPLEAPGSGMTKPAVPRPFAKFLTD